MADINSGLLAYWKLDEATAATTVADSSGNGRTGTATGTTIDPIGQVNSCRSFNGTTDLITVPTFSTGTAALTVALWAYSTNFAHSGMMVMKKPVNAQWEFYVDTSGANRLKFRGGGVGGDTCVVDLAGNVTNSQWNHFAVTTTGTSGKIYVNGVLKKDDTVVAIVDGTTAGTNDILLSTYDGTLYPFNGKMDDVRIYNRVLSASDIMELANYHKKNKNSINLRPRVFAPGLAR